jgi:hypothetical protein
MATLQIQISSTLTLLQIKYKLLHLRRVRTGVPDHQCNAFMKSLDVSPTFVKWFVWANVMRN